MRRDHYVTYRSEEDIANIAFRWRQVGNVTNDANFDIVDFVENVLSKRFTAKGALQIRLFDAVPGDHLASVTYNPLTLHVDSEVWEFAKRGNPEYRHMIAHEIGHILLHDHYARPFSNDRSKQIKFALDECSAEWQANTFAGHFLLPDHVMQSFDDYHCMAAHCAVPQILAEERTAMFIKANRKSKKFEGDICSECGNFTLVRNGTCLKCDTCGGTTGCS
jgi:hypothetical protein